MARTLITGGFIVNAGTEDFLAADVLIEDGRIAAVGTRLDAADAEIVHAEGRLVMPGLVDVHSHADGAVFDADVQLSLLRQGVTTVIAGQDGVSYAPGDGKHATWYFAAINGAHPTYRGPGVADLLASYDGKIPVNVAYAVPGGTVRYEVMGAEKRPATQAERAAMVEMVAQGVADGAVGLSTGLDYAPGIFADADEIAALCAPLAPAGLPYITHMRGGYEDNAAFGVEEAVRIGQDAGVPVHIAHFHTRAAEAARLMDWAAEQGVSTTYDAYPYTRGCSIMAMSMLPPELNALLPEETVAILQDPQGREKVRREWFPKVDHNPSLGPEWPDLITIGHVAAPEFDWTHGLTLRQIAERRGGDPIDAALDLMIASNLVVNVIMAVRDQRPVEDLGKLIGHPAHLGGSDGIFLGRHPHPRARGTFACYLATYVRDHGFLTWPQAVAHLSAGPVARFHLGERGVIAAGAIADIALVDAGTVTDRATYDDPMQPATGIDDVWVAGRRVLEQGRLTGDLPGGGLRAATPTSDS